MHITLDALIVLDAVARGGSFARGAERLYRVPSAVSYSVQKLEQDLGVAIFDRSGHRAKLTDAGLQLLEDGRELLRQATELENRVRRVHAGWQRTLTIILGDLVVKDAIYPILNKLHEAPEHQPIEVCLEVGPQAVCWDRLATGDSDVAIGAPSLGSADEVYDIQPLGEVQLTLAMSRSHPLARSREPLSAESLAPYRIVRQAAWAVGTSLELHGAEYLTVADSSSQVESIRHGLGIGYVPSYMVRDDVAAGRLVTKRVVRPPEVSLVVASRKLDRSGSSALGWLLNELAAEDVRTQLVPRSVADGG
jgi:DNA-binding transcriptional LysR family regulator